MIRRRRLYRGEKEITDLWGKPAGDDRFIESANDSYIPSLIYRYVAGGRTELLHAPILDAGCGWGRILAEFVREGHTNLTGVDITQALLDECRERVPEVKRLIRGDISALPFGDATFQSSYASRVLQYVDDPVTAVAELARVTKPGGEVLVVQPSKWSPVRWIHYHTLLLSPSEVQHAFRSAGLTRIETFYFGFVPRKLHVPQIEYLMQHAPFLRRIAGLFGVRGTRQRRP